VLQQIIIVPTLINGWGTQVAEDWILISSAALLVMLLDLGAQNYFSNRLVILWAEGDKLGFDRCFRLAMGLYGAVILFAMVFFAASLAFLSWPHLIGVHTLPSDEAFWVIFLQFAAMIGLLPTGVLGAIYRSRGDYFHGVVLGIAAEAFRGFGVCAVVLAGGGPLSAAILNLLVAAGFWGAMIWDCRRRFGPIPFGLDLPSRGEAWTMATQSLLYFVPTAAAPLVVALPVLLLAHLSDMPNAVLTYTTGRTLTGIVRQFVQQLCQPIGAEIARHQALARSSEMLETHRQREVVMFLRGGRLLSGLAGLLSGFLIILSEPFLKIWTHGQVSFDPLLIAAFAGAILLMAPAQLGQSLFLYNNRPAILVVGNGGYTLGTIAFGAVLIGPYGATGAAAGTGFAEFLFVGTLVTYVATKGVGIALPRYLGRSYAVEIACLAASLAAADLAVHLFRPVDLLAIILCGCLWGLLIAVPAYYLLLAGPDRQWLAQRGVALIQRVRRA
jgi:O-antigen/teichoic acid export membrane protein